MKLKKPKLGKQVLQLGWKKFCRSVFTFYGNRSFVNVSNLLSIMLGILSVFQLIFDPASNSSYLTPSNNLLCFLLVILDLTIRTFGWIRQGKNHFREIPSWNFKAHMSLNVVCFVHLFSRISFEVDVNSFLCFWLLLFKPLFIAWGSLRLQLFKLNNQFYLYLFFPLTFVNVLAHILSRLFEYYFFPEGGPRNKNQFPALKIAQENSLLLKSSLMAICFILTQCSVMLVASHGLHFREKNNTENGLSLGEETRRISTKDDKSSVIEGLMKLKYDLISQNSRIQLLFEEKQRIIHSLLEQLCETESCCDLLSSTRNLTVIENQNTNVGRKSIFCNTWKENAGIIFNEVNEADGELDNNKLNYNYAEPNRNSLGQADHLLLEEAAPVEDTIAADRIDSIKESVDKMDKKRKAKANEVLLESDNLHISIDFMSVPCLEVIEEVQNEASSALTRDYGLMSQGIVSHESSACKRDLRKKTPLSQISTKLRGRSKSIEQASSIPTEFVQTSNNKHLEKVYCERGNPRLKKFEKIIQTKDDSSIKYYSHLSSSWEADIEDSILVRRKLF